MFGIKQTASPAVGPVHDSTVLVGGGAKSECLRDGPSSFATSMIDYAGSEQGETIHLTSSFLCLSHGQHDVR